VKAHRPKKSLGQHYLRDENIARKIVASLDTKNVNEIIEIGPGQGYLQNIFSGMKDVQFWQLKLIMKTLYS